MAGAAVGYEDEPEDDLSDDDEVDGDDIGDKKSLPLEEIDHEEEVIMEPEEPAPVNYHLEDNEAVAAEDDASILDEDNEEDYELYYEHEVRRNNILERGNDGMMVLPPEAFNVAYEEVIGDYDDDEPKIWYMPSLPFNTIVAVAILNTESKAMTKAEIFAFLEKHFPYYNSKHAAEQWCNLKCTHFYRTRNTRGEEIFKMDETHSQAAIRALHAIWQSFPDITSRFYSIKNPELWPYMAHGEYRHDTHTLVFANEPRRAIFMKPPFTEKTLLGIAMISFDNSGVTFLEVCSFIEYYFPAMRQDKKWKQVAFNRLKTSVDRQGMFVRCREGQKLLFAVAGTKGVEVVQAVEKFVREKGGNDPAAVSGLLDPDLWDDMMSGTLPYSAVPEALIEKVKKEIKPIEEKAEQDNIFGDLDDVLQREPTGYKEMVRKPQGVGSYVYFGGPIKLNNGRVHQTIYRPYNPAVDGKRRATGLIQIPEKK